MSSRVEPTKTEPTKTERDKITVEIEGSVYTRIREGETHDQAKMRLLSAIVLGEVRVNESSSVRFHFSIKEE